MNLVRIYHMKSYRLNRRDFVRQSSDLPLELRVVTKENAFDVDKLRGGSWFKNTMDQLEMGDFGYLAYLDGSPVGVGWSKHSDSKDYFFIIPKGTCYLGRFYTNERVRGHNIYPAIISALIEHEQEFNIFWLDIEVGNEASVRGVSKVGFQFQKEYRFIRVLRHTFGKKRFGD